MSEIEKAFELINVFATKAAEVAPIVWTKMIMLVQAESIAYLAVGGFCLVMAQVFTFLWYKAPNTHYGEYTVQKAAFLVVTIVAYVPAAVNLLYPWNWIGAFAPEARLIARILGSLTGTTS